MADVTDARHRIMDLRESGIGMELPGSQGTLWGALNAVSEFVDHHASVEGARLPYALFGDGMALKARAYELIRHEAQRAASTDNVQ